MPFHRALFIPFVLTSLAASVSALAADFYTLPDVVVTASRLPQPMRDVIGDVTVLTQEDLSPYRAQSLADVLADQPGVQVTSNGGPGKTTSFFIRGANTEQTVVLIDGIRYGSATTGQTAIQHLPVAQIDRIEILRGAAASLYGADAIGGVVQVFTKQGGKVPHYGAEIGWGTQGTREASANLSGSVGSTRYSIGIAHNQTDGVSALINPNNSRYYGDLDGYENTSLSFSASHKIDERNEFGGSVLVTQFKNHFDSSFFDMTTFTEGAQSYDYRNTGTNGSANLWSRNRITEHWTSTVQAGVSVDEDKSYSPTSLTNYTDHIDRFKTQQTQLSWQNAIRVGPGIATLGAETLQQNVSSTTAFTVDSRRINSAMGGYLMKLEDWTLQTNLRYDHNSQFGGRTTGLFGVARELGDYWQAGGNFATGYHAPSINDLYFPFDGLERGNPNLKPETSTGGEGFLRFHGDILNAGATAYRNKVKNLITWSPDNTGIYTPMNVGSALLEGITLKSDLQFMIWRFGGSYDWLKATDASNGKWLPHRARNSGLVYAGLKQGKLEVRGEIKMVGSRFDDTANTVKLDAYKVANIMVSMALGKNLTASARFNNLNGAQYQEAKDYGVLGRNVLFTLSWQQ